jgi:dimethylamine monooxygenase subunit A
VQSPEAGSGEDVLAELVPAGEFRFHLGLRRGNPADFFLGRDGSGALLAERRRWLAAEPARHAVAAPAVDPLVAEFNEIAAGWGGPRVDHIMGVGSLYEPDILFLARDSAGHFRFQGGAVCFPTGWAPEEKRGHSIEWIHSAVPGLNPAIGAAIHQFLSKLKPGMVFLRDNWGIAATDELNLHPHRGLPVPLPPFAPDRLWLRVEHQALLALPRSGGVVFGIRIQLYRLDTLTRPALQRLYHAIGAMPDALAEYKRIQLIKSWLREIA